MAAKACPPFHLRDAAWRRHPSRDRADDEPERPRRRRAGGIRKVDTAAGGPPDVIVDAPRAARLLRDPVSNITPPSGLVGYESAGEPIGIEDDEADA